MYACTSLEANANIRFVHEVIVVKILQQIHGPSHTTGWFTATIQPKATSNKKTDIYLFREKIKTGQIKEIIRVMFQNVHSLGFVKKEHENKDSITKFIQEYKMDIFGMLEINTHWELTSRKI